MFQSIHEKIAVSGTYHQARFIPQSFVWQHRHYPVEAITLISDIKNGQHCKRMYSLMASNRLHRVMFDRDRETWMLEEIWYE